MNLTVVTSTYYLDRLPGAIETLNNQTFKDWQHIIINDNNPEVRKVLPELCDGVKRHWIDIGFRTHYYGGLARNMGITAAFSYIHHSKRDIENEWIALLDDDDRWHPEHLESMIETLKENPDATMIAADMEAVSPTVKDYIQIRPCVIKHGGCDLGSFLYKTKLFKKYGYFDPHPRRKHKFDWELINKMAEGEGDRLVFTHKPTFIMSDKKIR